MKLRTPELSYPALKEFLLPKMVKYPCNLQGYECQSEVLNLHLPNLFTIRQSIDFDAVERASVSSLCFCMLVGELPDRL
jgi:hypothetical protein